MTEENLTYFDNVLSKIENLDFDISRFTTARDELQTALDEAKIDGYKTPTERLAEEVAANAARKKQMLEAQESNEQAAQ